MKMLVVSQQRWISESLAALMSNSIHDESMEIVPCATDSVVETAQTARADVVLLDMSADVLAGITLVRRIKEVSPATHIVALGSDSDETVVYQAVLAGADGYLLPDTSAETLASTLRGVIRGELGLPRTVALTIVRRLSDAATNSGSMSVVARAKLTQREREVFELVLRGLRSRDISRQLYIAESTVYKHIQNILDKLQMRSRAQAIFFSAHNDEHAPPPTDTTQ